MIEAGVEIKSVADEDVAVSGARCRGGSFDLALAALEEFAVVITGDAVDNGADDDAACAEESVSDGTTGSVAAKWLCEADGAMTLGKADWVVLVGIWRRSARI